MKRPTQVDVARLAGVSRATVSYIVNGVSDNQVPISEETRRRVMAAIDELGYEPDARAQALRLGNMQTVGLILPDVHNPHFWQTADGVEQVLRPAGYHLLLSSADLNPEYGKDIFTDLSRRRMDGLILIGSSLYQSEEAQRVLARLLKRRFPIAKIGEHPSIDCVASDYAAATRQALAYLLSLGHRRIGLIYGVRAPGDSSASVDPAVDFASGRDRLLPYQECLRDAGLAIDPALIVTCGTTIEDGYQAARRLLGMPTRPTALLAINDLLAIGALLYLFIQGAPTLRPYTWPLVFGGVRLPLTHNFSIGGEVRYQRAEGELDASLFNGDRIDLGGITWQGVLQIKF